MEVKTILELSNACTTEVDANRLLDTLQEAFLGSVVGRLVLCNAEALMEEDGKPFVRFELNKVLSGDYVTVLMPEIRNGKFEVVVVTNRMLDGLGLSSQSWEAVDGMEDVIECDPGQSLSDIAQRAKDLAIGNHARLIEQVGVAHELSLEVAQKSW